MESALDAFLEEHSSLTRTQIEAMALKNRVRIGEFSTKEAISKRGESSMGSYYRVLSQAKSNVTRSIYTLLLASRIGVTSLEDLQRLLLLVSKIPAESSSTDLADVISLVEALVKKLVIL
jgi:hypothetical protein